MLALNPGELRAPERPLPTYPNQTHYNNPITWPVLFYLFYFYCKKHVVILNCLDQRITGYLTRKNIVKTFLIENKIMLSFYSSFVWKKIILSELTAVPNKNIIL